MPRLPRNPRAVTFDCWKTLIYEDDWELAHAYRVDALARAAAEAGAVVSRDQAGKAFDAAWQLHIDAWEGGVATGARKIAQDALHELGLKDPIPTFEQLVVDYEEASHTSQIESLEGAGETLAALRNRGVRCALVCDTGLTPGRVVRHHLERLGLLQHLEVCVFSDEVGVPKPHPRTFLSALGPLGVAPDKAVHVGDLRRTDVAGARALGMGTVRIRDRQDDRSELPEADAVADSHAELRGILAVDGS